MQRTPSNGHRAVGRLGEGKGVPGAGPTDLAGRLSVDEELLCGHPRDGLVEGHPDLPEVVDHTRNRTDRGDGRRAGGQFGGEQFSGKDEVAAAEAAVEDNDRENVLSRDQVRGSIGDGIGGDGDRFGGVCRGEGGVLGVACRGVVGGDANPVEVRNESVVADHPKFELRERRRITHCKPSPEIQRRVLPAHSRQVGSAKSRFPISERPGSGFPGTVVMCGKRPTSGSAGRGVSDAPEETPVILQPDQGGRFGVEWHPRTREKGQQGQ